jgi:SAM-dependent methyltransferase
MTAFVLQQVPDRISVLREINRVLRPGGAVAIYGWLDAGKKPFTAEVALDEALAEVGVSRPPLTEKRAGHYRSVRSSAAELRAAGFRHVSARADALEHAWTIDGFIAYRTTTRELDLFETMGEETRQEVLDGLNRRLKTLTADQMVDRPPVVSIVGRKP